MPFIIFWIGSSSYFPMKIGEIPILICELGRQYPQYTNKIDQTIPKTYNLQTRFTSILFRYQSYHRESYHLILLLCLQYQIKTELAKLIILNSMQKKYKRALIISIVTILTITLILVLLGLAQIGLNECALNYNTIMANYSDTSVYGSGLYWIGLSNRFIRINKNQQILSYSNLSTFTTDFYALTASLEVSLLYQFTNTSNASSTVLDFNTVKNFYQTLGDNPSDYFYPLIKNEILIILSSHDSLFYQNTDLANIQLQSDLEKQLQAVIATWINCTVNVIIQTLVCQGTSTNTQILDRQVQSLLHDVERVANEKVQLTTYFDTISSKKEFQILSANAAINLRASQLKKILTKIQGNASTLASKGVLKSMYYNQPVNYDSNLLNILQQLVQIGNRTFPY